jgi:hypothetical protein
MTGSTGSITNTITRWFSQIPLTELVFGDTLPAIDQENCLNQGNFERRYFNNKQNTSFLKQIPGEILTSSHHVKEEQEQEQIKAVKKESTQINSQPC